MKEATDWLKWISGKHYWQVSTFRFRALNSRKLFCTFSYYAGLCKEHSSKQVTDNFQHRALLRKIVETLKKSIFSFTIVNLVNKSMLHFLITTGVQLQREEEDVSPTLFWKLEESVLIWGKGEKVYWFWPSMC